LEEKFDPAQYANSIIQATSGSSVSYSGVDISTAVAKLNFSIDHLNKLLHEQVRSDFFLFLF